MTPADYQAKGWQGFERGMGSTPYDPSVEAGWLLLFPLDMFTREQGWIEAVPGRADYAESLAVWMGDRAAALALEANPAEPWVHDAQLLEAFTDVRRKARRENGGVATNLCNG